MASRPKVEIKVTSVELTKRELFAALALAPATALAIASPTSDSDADTIARMALEIADALIARLDEKSDHGQI